MLRLKHLRSLLAAIALPIAATAAAAVPATTAAPATAASAAEAPKVAPGGTDHASLAMLAPTEQASSGSVSVGGRHIEYQAVTGTLVVHPKGWSDAPQEKDSKNPTAVATMSYVAYFEKGAKPGERPITFLYNGGPGSSTVWLHMGAFGPRRVVTRDDTHTPAAPYAVVNNEESLLDASDLVFVDAPGTGFGRIVGKDAEKAFYGVDPDVHAFASFITQFASKFNRWNSPKYLFGESYGTPRSAALVKALQNHGMEFNGVVLLSTILNDALSIDGPNFDPGVDLPYELALPSYAATAWYHDRLPGTKPAELEPFLQEVERFAMTDYAQALSKGTELDDATRNAIAATLHQYTGLPVAYILKADLRIDGGEFEQTLQVDADTTTGRLDSRFSGPSMDPLNQRAEYDPLEAAIGSAYVSAFNDYVRRDLNYGRDLTYKPFIEVWKTWDFQHQPPGAPRKLPQAMNVMPDLATALKVNPNLRIMVNGGYYDIATPFYEGWYEMHHLPIPAKLAGNIEYHYYPSGHMVYAHLPSLKALHDNVAAFIRRTDNLQ
jgi:carboxypeptidase C (cathepsin A)